MRQVEKLAKALVPVLHGNVDKESADAHATHIKQVIQDLLASPSLLIKPTQRIAKIKKAEEVLSMDHHIKAATSFFATFHEFQEDTCVSLLLAKLLIALGEGVVYLDQTIAPGKGDIAAEVIDPNCCLYVWKSKFENYLAQHASPSSKETQLHDTIVEALAQYSQDGHPDTFRTFRSNLHQLCLLRKLRVWMLVDDATSDALQNFPIVWPKEQYLTAFHFVLTGSVGLAKFVTERYLERQSWDLPLFDLEETASLALRLQSTLNLPTEVIEGAFGLNLDLDDEEQTKDKMGEFLFGLFGGVPGYVAELFVALSRECVVDFKTIDAKKSNAQIWLNQMNGILDPWKYARNAGLCGSTPPRGAIFRYMLEALFFFAPRDNVLETVKYFRMRFFDDPGLEGVLMELEVILKLQHEEPIQAALITLKGEQWVPEAEETVPAIRHKAYYTILPGSNHTIQAPLPFSRDKRDVSDTIQDYDRCTPGQNEASDLSCLFNNTVPTEEKVFCVMVAPHCNSTDYSPPAGHRGAFFFSPRPSKKQIPEGAKTTSETEEIEMAQAVEQKLRATKTARETSSDDLSKSKKRKTNKSQH
ncbi:unnamed protein product [Aphanomyces euteiches]